MSVWIESHATLRAHPKLFQLCDRLQIQKVTAIGHLHLLWWWALDYADDGRLTGVTANEIARAMEWTGDAEVLCDALRATEFLDETEGVLTIHKWETYTVHYVLTLERKERKRNALVTRVKRFRNAKKRIGNAVVTRKVAATRPNQTRPNPDLTKTKPNQREEPPLFVRFWDLYPERNGKKLEKAATRKRFEAYSADEQTLIVHAAKNYDDALKDSKLSAKDPKRWLRDGQGCEPWRDWVTPATSDTFDFQAAIARAKEEERAIQ